MVGLQKRDHSTMQVFLCFTRWQHWMIIPSMFVGDRYLTSLWCSASPQELLLPYWCRVTSLCRWHMMKVPFPPSMFTRDAMCTCLCTHVPWVFENAGRKLVGMCVGARSIPFYPKMLRLRFDGQPHTQQRLGHQRLSVGWAANEVWWDWLV